MSPKPPTSTTKKTHCQSPAGLKWVRRLILAIVLYAACSVLDRIKDRWYVLDPTHLHALAQAAVRAHPDDINAIIPYIVSNLTAEYPASSIALNLNASEWVLSNAGGAMGAMYIVHASITEHLFIFGTPLGTEGHTGMHTADDYFHILVGEQWAFDPPKLEREVYRPGDVHILPRGHVKQYKMHEGCFALEYARGADLPVSCRHARKLMIMHRGRTGWIPLMLPFGVLDVFTSTLDFWSLYHTVRISVREFARNLLIGKI
ncbi:C-8 sterol isomerase [Polyporus arcularius HHB13444]|uniref:C-8 sterol isomerase n=1 Tax=Polyporus arcularius HHB13444 TaxID=1314778 RepID=A0A5C3PC63_9APHY|nr:C-8 sterol isomerase [Polyporus arcularius HHB13444]